MTFGHEPRLRTHVDSNHEDHVLVYEFFKTDLLELVSRYPALPLVARKQILYEVGRALETMHTRKWIHLDLKPDNVMLNWVVDGEGTFELQEMVLGDLDCALELMEGKPLNAIIGNAMWRSPEGQLGRGIGKYSEVFSFGLLCLYVITGKEWPHFDRNNLETDPEPVMLFKLLTAFGPLPEALVSHIDDADGAALLNGLWQAIEEEQLFDPLELWNEQVFPNLDRGAKRLISSMTHLDPARRLSISDVLEDPYWDEVASIDAKRVGDSARI